MKLTVITLLFSGIGVLLRGAGLEPHRPAAAPIARRMPVTPTGSPLAGRVLAAPFRVLRLPVGGHVTNLHVSPGQPVRAHDLLLTLAVGDPRHPRSLFLAASAAGIITHLDPGAGAYPAGPHRLRPPDGLRSGARAGSSRSGGPAAAR